MKNTQQCSQGLVYNSFSILLFQTFTAIKTKAVEENDPFASKISSGGMDKNLDIQLFTHNKELIERYNLPGFDIELVFEDDREEDDPGKRPDAILSGHVHVQAAVFFKSTVQVTYRFVVDKKQEGKEGYRSCRTNHPFNTDELISAASIVQQAEHWQYNKTTGQQQISKTVKSCRISNAPIDKSGDSGITFGQLQQKYRQYFDLSENCSFRCKDHQYTLIDVWEDFGHEGDGIDFEKMDEAEIIEHIELHHKAELIGLMSLYPYEWPYRMDASYNDVCGSNIAIDTDDLVLANQNLCLVFGTYGKRGEEAPTHWKEHLQRREAYHVSWPEYVILLQLLLAKKVAINYVHNRYINTSLKSIEDDTKQFIRQIEDNAKLCIRLSNMLLELDALHYLRFVSHKHMYEMTERNMRIREDEERLRYTMDKIDNALLNANNILAARQSEVMKNILFFISIASLFSVLLQNEDVPIISLISREWGVAVAILLEIITLAGILYGLKILYTVIIKKKCPK